MTEAPLKQFGASRNDAQNPMNEFTIGKHTFREGDKATGTWVDFDGRTYFQEGTIIRHEVSGLWLQSPNDGGITPLKKFWTMYPLNS
jgi:hypothetical protein